MAEEYTTTLRVRYSETDQMGTFYNSRALEWFEVARTETLRRMGLSYAEMESRGALLPLVEAHVEFLGRAKYDDELTLTTRVAFKGKARLRFDVDVESQPSLALKGHARGQRQFVVVLRPAEEFHVGLHQRQQRPARFHLGVGQAHPAECLGARDLEPFQGTGVVKRAHLVGLAVADAESGGVFLSHARVVQPAMGRSASPVKQPPCHAARGRRAAFVPRNPGRGKLNHPTRTRR